MKRPTGVTIIGVLAIVAGLIYLLSSVPFFGVAGFLSTLSGSVASLAGGLGVGIGVVALVLGVMYLILGYGSLSMKSWAWTLGIVVAVVAAVFSIGGMMIVGLTWGNVITALLSIGVIVYLYTADVREAFGKHTSSTSSHTPSMTA